MSASGDEPRHRAVEISLTSGIICPFTSYVGVRTSQKVSWYQGKERHVWERAGGAAPWDAVIPLELEHQPQANPITTRCFFPTCLIQPLSLFDLQGPLALLPPQKSLIPCQIVEIHAPIKESSCRPVTIWVPPAWLTAVHQLWLALCRLTQGIAALPQRGSWTKGMG